MNATVTLPKETYGLSKVETISVQIMEFSLSTPHYPNSTSPFSAVAVVLNLNQKHHSTTTTCLSVSPRSTPLPPQNSEPPTTTSSSPPSNQLRRPKTLKTASPPTKPTSKFRSNPFKNLINITQSPTPPVKTTTNTNSHPRTDKLWLTSKLSPPPPPPPPPPETETLGATQKPIKDNEPKKNSELSKVEFRQDGKIFVGNLPNWVKKNEVSDFFRQFGPIKSVILIKVHSSTEQNAGFGFVIYGGTTAAKSAMKAVEFDGVEFHGRVLTVKLDDGRRLKEKTDERAWWLEGYDGVEYRSQWHKERESSRKELCKVMETEPENWQAVVRVFERIKKPSRGEYGLMVKYYARRGDMHRARETFESMRARGIEPSSHVYTSLIHAYAVGRDMDEALSCVRNMKEEGIEMSLVTYSIIVGGFAKVGSAELLV